MIRYGYITKMVQYGNGSAIIENGLKFTIYRHILENSMQQNHYGNIRVKQERIIGISKQKMKLLIL